MRKRFVLTVGFILWATSGFGDVWTNIGNPSGSILGYTSLSSTQTWVCAGTGGIYFYDGESLTLQETFSGSTVRGIHALDATHVWAAGYHISSNQGEIFFYDGTHWETHLTLTNAGDATKLYDIYAASENEIWACGNLAQIWITENGGDSWAISYDSAESKSWYSIDGADASHVWAAGAGNNSNLAQVIHFNGSDWTLPWSEYIGYRLYSISAAASNDVWAIGGTNGTVLRFQNGVWGTAPGLEASSTQYDITRTPCGDTWATAWGKGIYYLEKDDWVQDTNRSDFIWSSFATPWCVLADDAIYGVFVRSLLPEVSRVGSGIGFSWNSVPGRTYQIEWADEPLAPDWKVADTLTAGSWTTYWGDIGDGTTNRPSPSADRQRIYRVVQP
jgi:hypothetical protein